MKWANSERTALILDDGAQATLRAAGDVSSIGSGPARRQAQAALAAGGAIAAMDPVPVADPDAVATRELDAGGRALFEVAFDSENRLRVLEGKPPVTRAQYRAALLARLKA